MILECILAIFVICIGFTLFLNMVKVDNKSFKIRNDMRVDSIIFSNIINEIKFNTSIEELEDKFKEDKIKIGIDNNTLKKLKTDNVLDINSTDLNNIIYTSDKLSRNCFSCKSEKECYWDKEKKNLKIKY